MSHHCDYVAFGWPDLLGCRGSSICDEKSEKSHKFSSQQSWQHYSSVQSQTLDFSLSFLQGCLSFEGCATVLVLIQYPVCSLEVNGPSFYFYLSTPYLQEFKPPPSHHSFIKRLKLGVNNRLFSFRELCVEEKMDATLRCACLILPAASF